MTWFEVLVRYEVNWSSKRFSTKPGVCHGLHLWHTLWPTYGLPLIPERFLYNFGIQTSYLVQVCLLAMAIYGITCCYENLVTMATEACVHNFAV